MSSQDDFMRKVQCDLQGVNLSELMETAGEKNTKQMQDRLREEFAHLPPPLPSLQVPKVVEYPRHKYNRQERRRMERQNKKQKINGGQSDE